MTTRTRNPKGQGRRLREEILTAGLQVLAGAADAGQLTIRAVAGAAGVTPPSIYLYFPDRPALLRAITERGFRLFDEHLRAAVEDVDAPPERLRRMCHAYVDFAQTNPGIYRVAFSSAGIGPHELGIADGEQHPGQASLETLIAAVAAAAPGAPAPRAIRLWCFLHGLADLRLTKPTLPWPPAGELIDAMLADLAIPTAHVN